MKTACSSARIAALLLACLLPCAPARAADEAAIKAEIETVRKATLERYKDRLPDNFEDYVRDTGTRNYYRRQFTAALVAADAAALTNVLKEFPEFARPQYLHAPTIQGKSPFVYAVEQGHRAIVEALLAHRAGPDRPLTGMDLPFGFGRALASEPQGFERRDTPLHLAVRGGRVEIARLLLKAGANLEAQDPVGETALQTCLRLLTGNNFAPDALPAGSAARAQQDALLTVLLQHGARIWSTNRFVSAYDQPMAKALSAGNEDLLDRLLTESLHLNATNQAGDTLVHFAVSNGRLSALKALLEKKASPTATNKAGYTPLQTAARLARLDRLPASPVGYSPPRAPTLIPLAMRAQFVRQESADLLLAAGAVMDAHSLAGLGRTNDLTALLQREPAQVNAPDSGGRRPLHYAVEAGEAEALAILLKAGADTEHHWRSGLTPLLLAIRNRQPREALLLLAAGAQPAAADANGQTALHLAIPFADTNVLAALHRAGADVNARDPAGTTPLDLAAQLKRFDIVAWLRERGAQLPPKTKQRMTTAFHQAISSGNFAAVGKSLAEGAEVDTRDERGQTPLRRAVDLGRADLVHLLLTNGANVNLPDTNGVTPLRARFIAASDPVPDPVPKPGFSKRPPPASARQATATRAATLPPELFPKALAGQPPLNNLLLLLLENGADPKLPDAKGHTLLHALPPNSPPLPVAIARVRLLANYGLAPDTRATNGLTPLHVVAARADFVHTFALLEAGAGVNTSDRQGRTVLHHVLTPQVSTYGWQHDQVSRRALTHTLALLLDNGADLRRTDTNGATPLHLLPAMDVHLRDLVLPMLKTNRHFAAALKMKNKAGQTPALLTIEELRKQPITPIARLLATLLDSGGELPPTNDLGGTTLLHELAGIGVIGHPFFGASQTDAESTTMVARLASNVVKRAASVDVRNAKGETPLHVATRTQNTPFAAALLARGANPNAQDAQGDTPLHLALRSVAANTTIHPVIPLLMSNRCNLVLRNIAGETPLRLEITRRFASHGTLFLPPGATQGFFQAARAGDSSSLDAYLSLDPMLATLVHPDTQTSALRSAALTGQKEIAERLRRAGATDPVSAALLGWTNSLALLVQENPNIGETNFGFGMPLLHLAASRGQTAAVQLLLTKPILPGLEDAFGRTAFYHATTNGSSGLVTWLTAHGMQLSLFDAVALADSKRLEAVLATGPDRANETNRMALSALLMATDLGNLDIVQRLLAHGADPNQSFASSPRLFPGRFIRGTVPLHLAAWSNRTDLAEALVGAKASLSVVNERGYSALHFAAARGHAEMAGWLLARGADANAQPVITDSSQTFPPKNPYVGNSGWTPLHVAVRFAQPGTIQTLVKHGAKLDSTDSQGRTPADLLGIATSLSPMAQPWPPSPMFSAGMGFGDVRPNPARAAEVTELLRKLGAVIPSSRGATFINRGPPPGFLVPPTPIPPAAKP